MAYLCRILVPRPGIEPEPLAMTVQGPNPWTTREFPRTSFFLDRVILSRYYCYGLEDNILKY